MLLRLLTKLDKTTISSACSKDLNIFFDTKIALISVKKIEDSLKSTKEYALSDYLHHTPEI